MLIQVIGAGLGRTGIFWLKAALEELGFAKCYHMGEVLARMDDARTWDAAARRAGRLGPALRWLPGDRRLTGACSISELSRSTPGRKSSSRCAIRALV